MPPSSTPVPPSPVPSTPAGVVAAVLALVDRPGRVRLALDGAPAREAHELADDVVSAYGGASVHVRVETYWRPASVRLEWGRHDEEAWLRTWVDEQALRREVLDRAVETGLVLPALRDPLTDRSLRVAPVQLPDTALVVVSGSVLLGRGLPFDVVVHRRLSSAALLRRTPAEDAWTLPALADYDAQVDPTASADLVVLADDPRRPALLHAAPGCSS